MTDYNTLTTEGFNAWLERYFGRLDIQLDDQIGRNLTESHEMAVAALERAERNSGQELAEPGVRLFAEWVAAATMVRSDHGEPALQSSDIEDFLPVAMKFLNTLFCGPPV